MNASLVFGIRKFFELNNFPCGRGGCLWSLNGRAIGVCEMRAEIATCGRVIAIASCYIGIGVEIAFTQLCLFDARRSSTAEWIAIVA